MTNGANFALFIAKSYIFVLEIESSAILVLVTELFIKLLVLIILLAKSIFSIVPSTIFNVVVLIPLLLILSTYYYNASIYA